MDWANAELVKYLATRSTGIHLISHGVDPTIAELPGVSVTRVAVTAGSRMLGEPRLTAAAHRIVRRLRANGTPVVTVANGGNYENATVNWAHYVHAASPSAAPGAPAWFRAKDAAYRAWARSRERHAFRSAAMVIANSRRTRSDVLGLGIVPSRVRTVYLGTDETWRPPSSSTRVRARRRWCEDDAQLVVFVGSLGHDDRKGIDALLSAWRIVADRGSRLRLLVAGHGALRRWRAAAADLPSVQFLGHISEIDDVLNAADLLVSPVRYEPYGLAVHEAICRGVPAIVSRSAGVAERIPAALSGLLLEDHASSAALVDRIERWRAAPDTWRERTAAASQALRRWTAGAMAHEIVEIALAASRGDDQGAQIQPRAEGLGPDSDARHE